MNGLRGLLVPCLLNLIVVGAVSSAASIDPKGNWELVSATVDGKPYPLVSSYVPKNYRDAHSRTQYVIGDKIFRDISSDEIAVTDVTELGYHMDGNHFVPESVQNHHASGFYILEQTADEMTVVPDDNKTPPNTLAHLKRISDSEIVTRNLRPLPVGGTMQLVNSQQNLKKSFSGIFPIQSSAPVSTSVYCDFEKDKPENLMVGFQDPGGHGDDPSLVVKAKVPFDWSKDEESFPDIRVIDQDDFAGSFGGDAKFAFQTSGTCQLKVDRKKRVLKYEGVCYDVKSNYFSYTDGNTGGKLNFEGNCVINF